MNAEQASKMPMHRPTRRPGPLDETAWVLLAANAAAGAKLRQVQPLLTLALRAPGLAGADSEVQGPGP
jgi:hypothetical protein